jgi:ketosteroid isomerase-like protein
MKTPLEVVNHFYELTDPKGRNVSELLCPIGEALTDDFKFTGPLMRTEGRAQYVGLLGQFLQAHVAYKFHKQFEDDDEVCSIYEMTVRTPTGGTLTITMVDWLKLQAGRIAEQRLYYDPREFAVAFGMQ